MTSKDLYIFPLDISSHPLGDELMTEQSADNIEASLLFQKWSVSFQRITGAQAIDYYQLLVIVAILNKY
jgi:hypothetical protein